MNIREIVKRSFPTLIVVARKTERLILRFLYRLLPFDRSMSFSGYVLYYQPGNALIARVRKAGGSFEEPLVDNLVHVLGVKHDPVFLDIGANLGLITLAVKRAVPQTRVYAFEPGPTQHRLLCKTVEKNNLSESVSVVEAAVADREGAMSFFTHGGGDEAKDGIRDTGRSSSAREIEVSAITLDAWATEVGISHVTAIKIDTEGAELLVLRGAQELLRRFRPIVYFELDLRNLKSFPYEPEDVLAFFLQEGCSVQTFDGEGVTLSNLRDLLKTNSMFVAVSTVR